MKKTNEWLRALMVACGLLLAVALPAQTALKSPQTVKTGLRILNQVVGHTGRLIAAKSYDQVPREAGEFTDGVAVLREGLAGEPAAFKAKIEPLIEKALKASSAMVDAAKAGNEATLTTTYDQFAAAVKVVIEAFPEDLRPKSRAGSPPPAGVPGTP